MNSTAKRLPLQPLLDTLQTPIQSLSKKVDSRTDRIIRYQTVGISEYTADRWAIALGYHPVEIWGELWWDLADQPEQCRNGHTRDQKNTRIEPDGRRRCRQCDNERNMAAKRHKRLERVSNMSNTQKTSPTSGYLTTCEPACTLPANFDQACVSTASETQGYDNPQEIHT